MDGNNLCEGRTWVLAAAGRCAPRRLASAALRGVLLTMATLGAASCSISSPLPIPPPAESPPPSGRAESPPPPSAPDSTQGTEASSEKEGDPQAGEPGQVDEVVESGGGRAEDVGAVEQPGGDLVGTEQPGGEEVREQQAGEEAWSRAEQDKVDELREAISTVDEILSDEQEEIETASVSRAGGQIAGEGDSSSGGNAEEEGGDRSEASDRGDSVTAQSSAPGGEGGPHARGDVPPDVGDGSNDDIVAAQLRELAEEETDPTLREAYWCDYRKYKGLVKECRGADSKQ